MSSSLLTDRAGAAQMAIQDMGTGDNHCASSLEVMVTGVALEQASGRDNSDKADNSDTHG
jgi:hypothetical protein